MIQSSREALIELLFLSLYLDDHLSLAEDAVFNDALEALGWDSELPRETFIFKGFAAARDVVADPNQGQEFLTVRAAEIRSNGDEAEAMTWLHKVISADGITETERYFLKRVEQQLFPEEGA